MIVELHLLQNLAPANINRDDTGAPKECEFGGVTRARVSSQSWKRAMREAFKHQRLLPKERVGDRTQQIVQELIERIAYTRPRDEAKQVVSALIEHVWKLDDKNQHTPYLILFSQQEIERMVALCIEHWDVLLSTFRAMENRKSQGKKASKEDSGDMPADIKHAFLRLLDGRGAADLALFGRMIADYPANNVEAAAQVAHAISTNAIAREMDYFTAVDDLQKSDTSGAGMIGTVEFNSACFYRYTAVDTQQLEHNLGGDRELAAQALRAYLEAMVIAIPSGKQNSFAAHNPPSLVMVVVRDAGQWSLTNAFAKPVRPTRDHDLVTGSIDALDRYWGRLTQMYGTTGIQQVSVAVLEDVQLAHLGSSKVDAVASIYANTLASAFAKAAAV